MIRAGDEAAKLDNRAQSFHLGIDGSIIAGKNHLIHSANAAQFFAVLLSPRCQAGIPGANFDGEHGVYPVLEPGRDELIDLPITIQGNDMDAV